MDIPYELPLPEPPVPPQAGQVQPDLPISSVSGDPLCQILDSLEASIEKTISIPNMCPDPLCKTLDNLEASIERQSPIIDRSPNLLNETLSRLENESEHQSSVAPKHKQDSPEEVTPPMQDGFSQMNRQFHPLFAPMQKPETFHRESLPLRQYSEPTHRMTGHSTGIRNSGNEFDWYCNIHRQWVTEDECNDCPDFEEADYVTEDKEDSRCKHSFTTMSDDLDINEENLDSNDQTDE